ncbi:MAG: MFS transporter [Desulfobacteraceae bacterium]|nr:MAG: MFS transporter [Desulfobacteraceae bacterium]
MPKSGINAKGVRVKSIKAWTVAKDPAGYRWIIFGLLSIVYFLACLHRISPTVIARDLFLEFGADATALGLMSSAYFYLYAAVQPPVGVLSDTLGPRAVVTLFTFIAGIGVLLFGFAPNMAVATVARGLIGIGVGGVFVPALKIFSGWYRPTEFAGTTGIFLATGNAGNLAASLPLTYLVVSLGWRMSFWAIGGVTLVLVVVCRMVLRDKPEDKGWAPIEAHTGAPSQAALGPEVKTGALKRFGIVFRKPNFWMVTTSYFFFGGPTLTFQGLWAVPYLMDVHGYSRVQAGGLLMLMPLGIIVGAPLFGFLADRLPVGRKTVLMASIGAAMACWGVFLVTGGKPPAALIGPLFFFSGACGGGSLSLYMTINKELFPQWLTGTAMGLMNPAAFLATALFQPISGYLMDAVGHSGAVYPLQAYLHVFIAIFVSMVLCFVTILPLSLRKADVMK